MPFDMAAAKAKYRAILHSRMAVAGVYYDEETAETAITVRWHNKAVRSGASVEGFDASIISGIDKLVFSITELTSLNLIIDENTGYVRIDGYEGALFKIGPKEPSDGPVNVYHQVEHQPE